MKILTGIIDKIVYEKKYLLQPHDLDQVIQDVSSYTGSLPITDHVKLDFRLRLETALLAYMDRYGSNAEFEACVYQRFGRFHIRLSLPGDLYEYKRDSEDEFIRAMVSAATGRDIMESYKYRHGANIVDFQLPAKPVKPVFYTLGALVAAIATGMFLSLFPPEVGQVISKDFFKPLFDVIMGVLGTVSVLMVFFAVLTGICSIGSMDTFTQKGRTIIIHCLSRDLLQAIAITVLCMATLNFYDVGGGVELSTLKEVYLQLLQMIPTDFFAPFDQANAMHTLLLAIAIGSLIIINSQGTELLVKVIGQINIIIMSAVRKICSLTPFIVYLSVFMMYQEGRLGVLMLIWKLLILMIASYALVLLFSFGLTAKRLGKPFLELVRKNFHIALTGLSTGSSLACTAKIFSFCQRYYGMTNEKIGLYFPMVLMLYKLHIVTTIAVFIYSMCAYYGIELSIATILLNMIAFTLLALSMAPIPAGDIPIMVIAINAAGLPAETIAIYTTISFIMNMINACYLCFNITGEIAQVDQKITANNQ